MRPSDEDFGWMAGAALREEATRARAAEVEKEAKLREAEARALDAIAKAQEQVDRAWQAKETAEREKTQVLQLLVARDNDLHAEQLAREKAEREMAAILDALPADVVVRVREGAGPESVAASLAVSVAKLRGRMEKAERERDETRAEVVALKRRLEWASKDAHVAHGAPAHVGPWEQCDIDSCTMDRAALGEKP